MFPASDRIRAAPCQIRLAKFLKRLRVPQRRVPRILERGESRRVGRITFFLEPGNALGYLTK